ncbi:MAG: serine hydrolase domain-containing protein [Bryobacteraceae bacterium]
MIPVLLLLLFSSLSAAGAGDYFPPPDSAGGWRTLPTPARILKVAGIDVNRLDQAFEYAQRTTQHGGLLVVRRGWLVYEKYFGRGNREAHPSMMSVAKAYLSIACGIMISENKDRIPEGLDQRVFDPKYLPEAFPLDDERKAGIKLGHLLAFTAGLRGGHNLSRNIGFVRGLYVNQDPIPARERMADLDLFALRTPMWCNPGEGYQYSNESSHIASMVLRHVTGMEIDAYVGKKLAEPMQWGRFGWARREGSLHVDGSAGIAVRSTDNLRFGYLLLRQGRWGNRQIVPSGYVERCGRPTPYNPHAPFSLQFDVNADGHVAGAPRDAFYKAGAGGFGLYVIPSLDMVIYKMAGADSHYAAPTGLPETYKYDGSRDNWQPHPLDQFYEGPQDSDTGVKRLLEMVVAAVVR